MIHRPWTWWSLPSERCPSSITIQGHVGHGNEVWTTWEGPSCCCVCLPEIPSLHRQPHTVQIESDLHFHPYLFLWRGCRKATTDDFTTSFLHFSLFCTALWDLANSRPVLSLMSSSHLFFCLPCLLFPLIVPCKVVLMDGRQIVSDHHCEV